MVKSLLCNYTCKNCLNAVCVKNAGWDCDRKYTCSNYPKKHKAISAKKCNTFVCNNPCFSICKKCRGSK